MQFTCVTASESNAIPRLWFKRELNVCTLLSNAIADSLRASASWCAQTVFVNEVGRPRTSLLSERRLFQSHSCECTITNSAGRFNCALEHNTTKMSWESELVALCQLLHVVGSACPRKTRQSAPTDGPGSASELFRGSPATIETAFSPH